MSDSNTGIKVTGHHLAMAWILYFVKMTVEVDGSPSVGTWNSRFVPLSSGNHEVKVFFKYLMKPRCGEAGTTITLNEGQILSIDYKAPFLMNQDGKLTVTN